eukprot:Filipodium_phascolosomae@DN531_c0_g1_i2.p1
MKAKIKDLSFSKWYAKTQEGSHAGNAYEGWCPWKSDTFVDTEIEKIDVAEITAELFYNNYVKPRKPVVIDGTWDLRLNPASWTNWCLKSQLNPETEVLVEERTDTSTGYGILHPVILSANVGSGKGRKKRMQFFTLLDEIGHNGNELLYMTTQVNRDEGKSEDTVAVTNLRR